MADDQPNPALENPFPGEAHGWIQWKGTEVCMDIHCECGELSHIDADFAYHVKCGACGRVYALNGHVKLHLLDHEPKDCVVESEIPDPADSGWVTSSIGTMEVK